MSGFQGPEVEGFQGPEVEGSVFAVVSAAASLADGS